MSHLTVHTREPLNAEPDLVSLGKEWLTPTSLVFKRNHGIIRSLPADHRVTLSFQPELLLTLPRDITGKAKETAFTADDLKAYQQTSISAVLQCAGNRRDEMSARGKKTQGLGWGSAVAANLMWTGVALHHLLEQLDLPLEDLGPDIHVEFISESKCEDDDCYASSVTLSDALDPTHPILLATRMNHEAGIPDEHGGPIRIVVPGQIGARSVKWLDKVVIRKGSSTNFYQVSDYKILPPDTAPDEKEEWMRKIEPLRQYSHQAVITEPADDSVIRSRGACPSVSVRGYAIRASRVEAIAITCAGDPTKSAAQDAAESEPTKAWTEARLQRGRGRGAEDAWQLWQADVHVRAEAKLIHIVCRCYDENGRQQPKLSAYNLRGVDNAEWFVAQRVRLEETID